MFENYSIGDVLGIFGRCCIFLLCCDLVWFGALCFFYLGLKWCFVAFVWLLAAVSSFFSAFQQKICEDSLTFFGDFGNFKQILIQRGATMQIFYNLFSQLQKYFDGKGQELSWIIWVWSKVYLERLFVVFFSNWAHEHSTTEPNCTWSQPGKWTVVAKSIMNVFLTRSSLKEFFHTVRTFCHAWKQMLIVIFVKLFFFVFLYCLAVVCPYGVCFCFFSFCSMVLRFLFVSSLFCAFAFHWFIFLFQILLHYCSFVCSVLLDCFACCPWSLSLGGHGTQRFNGFCWLCEAARIFFGFKLASERWNKQFSMTRWDFQQLLFTSEFQPTQTFSTLESSALIHEGNSARVLPLSVALRCQRGWIHMRAWLGGFELWHGDFGMEMVDSPIIEHPNFWNGGLK